MSRTSQVPWPELPTTAWRETCETLHLWTQIVGKIRLAREPWLNHSWHVVLYVTARGLTTSPIPDGTRTFQIALRLERSGQTEMSCGVLVIRGQDLAKRSHGLGGVSRRHLRLPERDPQHRRRRPLGFGTSKHGERVGPAMLIQKQTGQLQARGQEPRIARERLAIGTFGGRRVDRRVPLLRFPVTNIGITAYDGAQIGLHHGAYVRDGTFAGGARL
jgi:hypothetical protein